MRHTRLSILAGTAVALVLASPAGANPIYPGVGNDRIMPAPSSRDVGSTRSQPRPASTFAPADNTNRSRTVTPSVQTQQPNARIISTPNVPAARNEPAPAVRSEPALPPAVVSAPTPAPAPVETMAPPAPVEPPAPVAAPVVPQPAIAPVASEPVRTAPPAAMFAASDSEIAAKVRELVAKKQLDRLAPRKNERDAIENYYKNRDAMPLWFAGGQQSERARAAIAHLRTIDTDGLVPSDYPSPEVAGTSADAVAQAELKFTVTMMTYARHALNGRVHFSRISPSIDYKENFDAGEVMTKLASSADLRRTLDGFNPQHPGYKALKAKYVEMLKQPAMATAGRFEHGPVLKYGRDKNGREVFMQDARVPQLRDRLGLPFAADVRYDRALADAVARYQKANGITVTGQLTTATIDALNGPSREKQLEAMVATLERWRWMPRTLGATHVALNIPDFHLKVMHNGQQVWKTRVVVGKPTQATPLLTETMKFITVNPTWNVPQSIIYNELLPIYESNDPNIFARMGLSVERKPNGEVRVFQPPGERNALGRIRFNFPNKFLVYQHDTPEKHYFAHDKRAYSHGCMRVQDPMKYAEVLLSFAAPKGNYTQASLQRMFGGEERQIDFAQHIPVHISYQTAFVDDDGKLQFREDVYNLDKAVVAQLSGSERAVADVAIERPADPNFKPTVQHVQRLHSAARGGSPFSLFDQLFR
jgi:murein L,D-transpeptidase YcbB/YkuD